MLIKNNCLIFNSMTLEIIHLFNQFIHLNYQSRHTILFLSCCVGNLKLVKQLHKWADSTSEWNQMVVTPHTTNAISPLSQSLCCKNMELSTFLYSSL